MLYTGSKNHLKYHLNTNRKVGNRNKNRTSGEMLIVLTTDGKYWIRLAFFFGS